MTDILHLQMYFDQGKSIQIVYLDRFCNHPILFMHIDHDPINACHSSSNKRFCNHPHLCIHLIHNHESIPSIPPARPDSATTRFSLCTPSMSNQGQSFLQQDQILQLPSIVHTPYPQPRISPIPPSSVTCLYNHILQLPVNTSATTLNCTCTLPYPDIQSMPSLPPASPVYTRGFCNCP